MNLGLGLGLSFNRSNILDFVESLQVTISSPNSSPLDVGTVEFSGDATGPDPITTLEYQVDGGAFTSFTVAENWTVNIDLDLANTSVTIRATDDQLETATDTFNFTVEDTVAPTVGGSGTLATANVTSSGFDVTYTKSTDDGYAQSALVYELYTGELSDLNDINLIKSNGTLEDSGTDVATLSVASDPSTTTNFNILVRDGAGNEAIYTANSETTLVDTVSPTVSDPVLSTSSVGSSGWLVDFTKATDDHTAQADLVYKLYLSDTNNLDTDASTVETNGTLESQGTDVSTLSVSGLGAEVTKWFNIVVEDEAGNKSIYTQNSETSAVAGSADTQLPITTALEADYDILGTAVITEDNTLSVKTAQSWEEESSDQHTISNLTKAEQPVYNDVADQVEFDGQDDILSGAFAQFSTLNTTIFAYLKSPETADVKSLFSVYQNGNADTAFSHGVEFGLVDGKATCWYGDGTDNQMIQESVATDHTSYQVWEFVNDGGTRRFLIDGTEIGNSTTALSIGVDRLQMGGRGTGNFSDCDIKTVFFYTDNKSSADRTTLRNHINSRFAPADTTAPVLTNATGTQTGDTTADGTVDTDEANGTLYWVVTQNATTPSAAQIKTGNDHLDATADDSGNQVVSATGTQNVSSTGLTVDTTYYFHFMHEDSSANQSNTISSSSFTTGATNTFFRSFNNDTLGALPADFVELFGSSGGWTVVEFATAGPDQYLNQSAGGTGRDAVGWKQGTDVEVVTKYYRDGSSVIGGPATRLDTGGAETGYVVWNRETNNQKIVRHETGTETAIVANDMPVGHRWIIARFRTNSSTIQLRIHPVETFVASARSANDDFVLGPRHEFRDNMEVRITDADVVPGNLALDTSYFVRRIDDNQFALQASSPVDAGASDIDITSDGSNITFTLLDDETARTDWPDDITDENITGSGYAGLFDIFGNCYFEWIGIGLQGEMAPSS